MTWVKLDDGFFRHPKIRAAGRDARDLQLAALQYCNENLTDGFVPEYEVLRLAMEAFLEPAAVSQAVESLLDARHFENPMWRREANGYRLHDFHAYQPTREEVLADRRRNAERQADWRAKKAAEKAAESAPPPQASPAAPPHAPSPPESVRNAVTDTVSNAVSNGGKESFFSPRNSVTNGGTRIPYSESRVQSPEQQQHHPRAPAAPPPGPAGECTEVVVATLSSLGVTESVGREMVQKRTCEQVQRQIDWLPFRIAERAGTPKPVRDPAALLVRAIWEDWLPPQSWGQAKQKARELEARQERMRQQQRDREAAGAARSAGEAQLAAAWDALPGEERQALTEAATQRFTQTHREHAKKHALRLTTDPETMPPGPRKLWRTIRDALLAQQGLVDGRKASP